VSPKPRLRFSLMTDSKGSATFSAADSDGHLFSESDEGGDELLRIIKGFGNDFKQSLSAEVHDPSLEALNDFPCCKGYLSKDPRKTECLLLASLGYLETARNLLLWSHHFISLVILSSSVSLPAAASASFATLLMMTVYLPLRRGLPSVLRLALEEASLNNGGNEERDMWLRGAVIVAFPWLLFVSFVWGLGVGPMASAFSSSGRNVAEVSRFAHFSVGWVWLEVFLDILRTYLYARRVYGLRVGDVIINGITTPLLALGFVIHGHGIVSLPLSISVANTLRLVILLVGAAFTGKLPSLISSPYVLVHMGGGGASGRRRMLFRRGVRGRMAHDHHSLINSNAAFDDSSSEEAEYGVRSVKEAVWRLGKAAIIDGFTRSTWRTHSPFVILGIMAWKLGDAEMAAFGLLLSGTYTLLAISNHPGLSKATENRIRHYNRRAQPGFTVGAIRSAFIMAGGGAACLAILAAIVTTAAERPQQENGSTDSIANKFRKALETSSWAAAG